MKVIVASAGYLLLVPRLGVYGAALALLVSNLLEFYWINRNATREYDMGLQWMPVVALLAAGAACVAAGMLMPVGVPFWFIVRVVLYVCLAAVIYRMPIWHDSDREIMRTVFNKITGLAARR